MVKIREYWEQIRQAKDVRQNLISIKAALQEPEGKQLLRELAGADPELLPGCLKEKDPKIRKHAALLLGSLGTEAAREDLLAAYGKEETRFVKSAYLTALKGCDLSGCLDWLEEQRRQVLAREVTPETEKHLREELEALNALIGRYGHPARHRFRGNGTADVILTTNRNYREETARQIDSGKVLLLKAGVKVLGGSPEALLSIRTFRDLFFCLDTEEVKAETAAEELAASNLLELLEAFHEGEGPFFFRVECKSSMTQEQRGAFVRKLAARLQTLTEGKLENSPSDYEAELRLIETRRGGFHPLLKLYTLPDRRFSYRKHVLTSSIHPSLAALMMELAAPWLKEEGRVLDPFCGVGTMLLERNYRVHADTLYGVDRYGPAIEGARENAGAARVTAHYINRDFLDFTHQYPFDEIVTNMPVKGKNLTGHDLDFLYGKLFDRGEELLAEGGRMFLYSRDKNFVKKQLREHKSMKLLKEWLIHDREESWFFAIEYTGIRKAE